MTVTLFTVSLYLMFICLQKQKIEFILKLCILSPALYQTHRRFQLICVCVVHSGWEYWISPFDAASSYGLVQGSKGESVYSQLCQHMTSREYIPQLAHLAGIWEKSPRPRGAGWLSLGIRLHVVVRQVPPKKYSFGTSFQHGQIAWQNHFFVVKTCIF